MTNPTDEELDEFIKGYFFDDEDWWYDEDIVRGLARAILDIADELEAHYV